MHQGFSPLFSQLTKISTCRSGANVPKQAQRCQLFQSTPPIILKELYLTLVLELNLHLCPGLCTDPGTKRAPRIRATLTLLRHLSQPPSPVPNISC